MQARQQGVSLTGSQWDCHVSEGGREAYAGGLVLICAELWGEL